MLMARGAIISMLLVIFVLPAMFMLLDAVICRTTVGMTGCVQKAGKKQSTYKFS
jgi:hypothetical protein